MNKLLVTSTLAVTMLMAGSANAVENPYAKLQQQISTMSKIMRDNMPTIRGGHHASIKSTYLAGQGIVFSVESSPFGHWQWSTHMMNIPQPPEPTVAPVVDIDGDFEMEFYDDENIQLIINKGMEHAEDVIEIVREHYHDQQEEARELRSQEREIAREIRSLEREARDLAYRKRRAETDDKVELEELSKEMAKLEKEKANLKEVKVKLNEQRTAFAAKTKKAAEQRQMEKQKFYTQVEQSITESLCHFGNGLRALPKTENVNVIVKNAVADGDNIGRDKIYVFSKADIRDCSLENIDESKLLAKAKVYEY